MKQGNGRSAGVVRSSETLSSRTRVIVWTVLGLSVAAFAPEWVFAGTSPFTTGATAMNTNILAILTPIAVIGIMAIGAAAWFNKISWSWAAAAVVGVCLVFGGQQIVTWIRGMFGV